MWGRRGSWAALNATTQLHRASFQCGVSSLAVATARAAVHETASPGGVALQHAKGRPDTEAFHRQANARSANPIRHRRKFGRRCTRFRQASAQIGCAMRFLAFFAQFELRMRGNGNPTSLLLAKPGKFSKLSPTRLFFGGCALWRNHPIQGASNV